jgi:glycogen debranching enzyme
MQRRLAPVLLIAACHRAPPAPAAAPPGRAVETLAFTVQEGQTENRFFRRGGVAAHVLATSGEAPRLVVAFPAGNSGVGLWFRDRAELAIEGELAPVERGAMRGVRFTLTARAAELVVGKAILGGNWSLREWVPPGLTFPTLVNQVSANRIARATLDGGHHIAVAFEPLDGATSAREGDTLVLRGAPSARSIRVVVTATTDEKPLTPIETGELLTDRRGADPAMLRALAFLSYREALLAGSWRFLGYFGRDTLLSVRMLMPAARPELVEAGLGAVIDRLASDGRVAHYEESGEFVTLRRLAEKKGGDLRAPYFEYGMVDDDFLLAPVLADYLATPAGRQRAAAFLARRTPSGATYAEAVRHNLDLVMKAAAPFAAEPAKENLIPFAADYPWGDWRDSNEGYGGGRVTWSINVALVPAALRASGALLRPPAFGELVVGAERAEEMEKVWRARAPAHFLVTIARAEARRRVVDYGKKVGLDPMVVAANATSSLFGDVVIDAIALDKSDQPIPIQHSDDGFALLFGEPPADYLRRAAERIIAEFPAGLRTPVGVVVANPAYAPEVLQKTFTTAHYHGTVVWSWQQAMLAAGLARQLARSDLDRRTQAQLLVAQRRLWRVIQQMRAQAAGELWSFAVKEGRIVYLPFGQATGHADESNAAQLWSTVYLAVRPPPPD